MRPPSPTASERSRLSSHFDEEGGSEPSIILATGAARVTPRLKTKSPDHAEPSSCARRALLASRCVIPALLFVVLALLFTVWIARHRSLVRSLGLAQIDVSATPADLDARRARALANAARTWHVDYDYMHV